MEKNNCISKEIPQILFEILEKNEVTLDCNYKKNYRFCKAPIEIKRNFRV